MLICQIQYEMDKINKIKWNKKSVQEEIEAAKKKSKEEEK